jgi:hypothetical protein
MYKQPMAHRIPLLSERFKKNLLGIQDDNGVLCANDKYLLVSFAERSHTELSVICGVILYWHTGYQSSIASKD